MSTTKLLVSLPLSPGADKYFGKDSQSFNKPGDSGVDLPSVSTYKLASSVQGHNLLLDFHTLFAMYDTRYIGSVSNLENFSNICGYTYANSEQSALNFLVKHLKPMAYMLAPRSSISKTPFRLANSIGIVDSTYKGYSDEKVDTIKAAIDFVPYLFDNERHTPSIKEGDRLVQIISPDLSPIYHHKLSYCDKDIKFWCDNVSTTARGGFGSTNFT